MLGHSSTHGGSEASCGLRGTTHDRYDTVHAGPHTTHDRYDTVHAGPHTTHDRYDTADVGPHTTHDRYDTADAGPRGPQLGEAQPRLPQGATL